MSVDVTSYKMINSLKQTLSQLENVTYLKVHSDEEINAFEEENGLKLNPTYTNLLREIGSFKVEDDYSIFEIMSLARLKSWSEEVFKTYENPFPRVLLIASSTSGEEFGFIQNKQELYVFDPECPCDLWEEEQLKAYTFEDWLTLLAESKLETLW